MVLSSIRLWALGMACALSLAGLVAAGCTSASSSHKTAQGAQGESSASPPAFITSNVLRSDYTGSQACAGCHFEIFSEWERSPMHKMTRNVERAKIRAPFAGEEFHFKGDLAKMETQGKARFFRLRMVKDGERLYRVTRVIGGRYREDFVGIDVTETSDPVTAAGHGEERVMPASYVFSTSSWRYKGYSVLVKERPHLVVGGVWRQQCIFCHNTVPHVSTLLDELLGEGAPTYQGSLQNDLLPEDKKWTASVRDNEALGRALRAELHFLGEDAPHQDSIAELLTHTISATRSHFGPEHFIEVGIGCEACHGGSKEHVQDPRTKPTLTVTSPALQEHLVSQHSTHRESEPSPAEWTNRTCMRCHTVLFSRYGPTWEGGHRRGDPGGSPINSGEARDFMLGGCASQMSCTSCHSPHAEDTPARMEALLGEGGQALCTGCHQDLRSTEARALHSHHDPEGSGASCIGCHMPKKNMALDYRLSRYHRIGSPTDTERVERDRPLECALCHADKSVEELVSTMESWWSKSYDRTRLSRLYGKDPSVKPLPVTLEVGQPHEQVVAALVLAKSGDQSQAPALVRQLSHPYPLVRYFIAQALTELLGSWPEVDLDADPAEITRQAQLWLDPRMKATTTTGAALGIK